jgi:hypothetical protein
MIARGLKLVENRTWPTDYRGPLAIHAGRSLTWLQREDACVWPTTYGVRLPQAGEMAFGAFVAVAELVDCVPADRLPEYLEDHVFAEGPWCWILGNVRRIEPIRWPGQQQLWTVPEEVLARLK